MNCARVVDRIIGWLSTWHRHLASRIARYYDRPEEALAFYLSTAGMDELHDGKGRFALGAGEAMILELARPNAATGERSS